ncbi:hypothetical protein [Kitasatospora paranensis]|uniref:Uncharacterized protein n=1 Tax=Kitasatospora paranensis TaxID=258053 RepID=A0ABW2FQX4_9ACTN
MTPDQPATAARPDPAAPARVADRLDRAIRTGAPVRLHRSITGAERIDGFVVAATGAWTLLAHCPEVDLDGWTAVRTGDITKVRLHGDPTSLAVRALCRRGRWPVAAPAQALALDSLPLLLESAGRDFGLVTLHAEGKRPDVCWIGAVVGLRRKSVRLLEVDTEARWEAEPTRFPSKHITRVDFGGRYEETLREFAGPRPGSG